MRWGQSLRSVATEFGVSLGAVTYWVALARGRRLDRVGFANRKPGRASNRTPARLEQRILSTRCALRDKSVLGEYGPDAISLALQQNCTAEQLPSRITIYRVLARHGVLDSVHRQRRPAPPKGWYLPDLAAGQAELDSFDFIVDLKIAGGPLVDVLTGTSLHGALAEAWVMERPSARAALQALVERWRRDGLPTYAQFDNDTIFQGAHRFADTVGRISRLASGTGSRSGVCTTARAGLPKCHRRLQRPVAKQSLAAPPLPRWSNLGGRLRALHRGLSHQDCYPPRNRSQAAQLPQGLQAQPRRPTQGHHDLRAPWR